MTMHAGWGCPATPRARRASRSCTTSRRTTAPRRASGVRAARAGTSLAAIACAAEDGRRLRPTFLILRGSFAVVMLAAFAAGQSDREVPRTADTRFPFALIAEMRNEWGLPESLWLVPFGAVDGAVLTYCSELRRPGDGEHFEWTARENVMDVVVGIAHLRRITLRSGQVARIEPEPGRGRPDLDGGAAAIPEGLRTAFDFTTKLADGAVFAEEIEPFRWPRYRGFEVHHPGRTLRGRVFGREGDPPASFCVEVRTPERHGASTRRDGSYELTHLPPGEYEVRAGSIDGGDVTVRTTIGDTDAVLDLQLVYGPSLRGRVVDTVGEP